MAAIWTVWLIALASIISEYGCAEGQLHHVVGDDRGWEPHSDVVSWSSARTLTVGDSIWFAYSAAHGMIAELKSQEEYLSCDVSNAINIFTNGLDRVLLDGEGIRYFVSTNMESCKKGLKLPVHVMPKQLSADPKVSKSDGSVIADGPTTPSVSPHVGASFILLVAGIWLSCYFS